MKIVTTLLLFSFCTAARERLSMLWNPGSSLMHSDDSDPTATSTATTKLTNVFAGCLLIVVAAAVGCAVYTKSR